MLRFNACLDLALTHAFRNPGLARSLIFDALTAAHALRRPDLVYRANEVLAAL